MKRLAREYFMASLENFAFRGEAPVTEFEGAAGNPLLALYAVMREIEVLDLRMIA